MSSRGSGQGRRAESSWWPDSLGKGARRMTSQVGGRGWDKDSSDVTRIGFVHRPAPGPWEGGQECSFQPRLGI